MCGRDRRRVGKACVKAFGETGDRVAIPYHTDTDAAAFDAVERAYGAASILVNSAGLNMSGIAVRDMDLAQWRRLVDTDHTGAFLASRWFLTGWKKNARPGAIIHISSIHAYAMRAGGADYCAAKGGLTDLAETLAIEEAPNGVRVNAVEPGMILTPMNERAVNEPTYRQALEHNIPWRRAGQPSEVAALVRWLASDEAAYITGARIAIDGGLSLMQALGA